MTHQVKVASRLKFWHAYFVLGVVMVMWFVIRGLRDLLKLFRDLTSLKRNELDDGRVADRYDSGQ